MIDLQEIITVKTNNLMQSGQIEKKIEEALTNTINKTIEDELKTYSDFGRNLSKLIKENLKLDESKFEVPEFTAVMTKVVCNQINKFFKEEAANRFTTTIKEKLEPLPDEISINDFVNKIVGFWRTDDLCNCHDELDDYATVELKKDSGYIGGYDLKLWKRRHEGYTTQHVRSEDIHIHILDDGTIAGQHTRSPYYIFDAEAYIFKACAQGVKLSGLDEFDEYDCELSLRPEYD